MNGMKPADGRHQRAERTRRELIHALICLVAEGNGHPTGKQIAERAGRGERTFFNRFGDLASVYREAETAGAYGAKLVSCPSCKATGYIVIGSRQ